MELNYEYHKNIFIFVIPILIPSIYFPELLEAILYLTCRRNILSSQLCCLCIQLITSG